MDKEVVIKREQLKKLTQYIQEEYNNILPVFGFSKLKSETFDVKQTTAVLTKIYNSWNRCKLESVKDKHKKVIALTVKPHPSYLLFTPFVKQSRQEFQGCMIQIVEEDKVEIKKIANIEEPKVNKLKLNIKRFKKPESV